MTHSYYINNVCVWEDGHLFLYDPTFAYPFLDHAFKLKAEPDSEVANLMQEVLHCRCPLGILLDYIRDKCNKLDFYIIMHNIPYYTNDTEWAAIQQRVDELSVYNNQS